MVCMGRMFCASLATPMSSLVSPYRAKCLLCFSGSLIRLRKLCRVLPMCVKGFQCRSYFFNIGPVSSGEFMLISRENIIGHHHFSNH